MTPPETCPTCGAIKGWCNHENAFHQLLKKHGIHGTYAWSELSGDGWLPLIDRTITAIKDLGFTHVNVGQIKEKWGYLVLSVNGTLHHDPGCLWVSEYPKDDQGVSLDPSVVPDDYWTCTCTAEDRSDALEAAGAYKKMHDLIDEAERESITICELCGEPGQLLSTDGSPYGWFKTRCPEHTEEGYLPPQKEGEEK